MFRCDVPRRPEASDYYDPTENELETAFQREVVAIAKSLGWDYYSPPKKRRGNHGSKEERGFPDLTLTKPPRLMYAELKTEKGVLSARQKRWIDLLSGCPQVEVYVWRPSDLDGIARCLGA